jgi:hypothetical protein
MSRREGGGGGVCFAFAPGGRLARGVAGQRHGARVAQVLPDGQHSTHHQAHLQRYATVANRDVRDFGWENSLTGPFRDALRFRSTRWYPVPGATRTTLGFGICPSFKGHSFCRAVPNPSITIRNFVHRCLTSDLRAPKLRLVKLTCSKSPNHASHSALASAGATLR